MPKIRPAVVLAAAAGAAAVLFVAAMLSDPSPPHAATTAALPAPAVTAAAGGGGAAVQALAGLTVHQPGPLTDYHRTAFGPAWADIDHDGCDQRSQVLRRDMTDVVLVHGTACTVASGTLTDPYTGKVLHYRRSGGGDPVDVDHVVALADAWRSGASSWPASRRAALAGDPLDLLPTAAAVNRAKGDKDPSAWLPALPADRCPFAARVVAVKTRYGLSVSQTEHDALAQVLATCPGQQLPAEASHA